MLPSTLQFVIAMIACAINERMQRKPDYTQEEVRALKEILPAANADIPNKRVRNCGMVNITTDFGGCPFCLGTLSAILRR